MREKTDVHAATHGLQQACLYTDAGFFVLRTPALSARVFSRLAEYERPLWEPPFPPPSCSQQRQAGYGRLMELLQQPLLQLGVIIASRDLWDALARREHQHRDERRVQRICSRLLRYVIRGATRPTPFGLFAGITLGTFGAQTRLLLEHPALGNIRLRPDAGWLLALIRQIEQDHALLPHMQVLVNATTTIVGPRVVTSCANIYGEEVNRSVSLRTSAFLQMLLEQTRQPIAYERLAAQLHAAFPQVTEAQIHQLLLQLWDAHVLMSPLRPPLTTPEPASMLLHRLASVPRTAPMQQDLQGVLSFCEDINKEGLQALIERQEEVIAWQRQIAQRYQQQAFQVDAALAVRTPVLSQRLASAAAQAAELLLRMSTSPKGTPALAAYRTAFVQKYGAAEVPLLTLLSAEHGLGAPTTYRQPPREYPLAEPAPTPYDAARSRLLCALLAQAMHAQSIEVQLTDAQCAALASWSPSSENPPPPSLEVFLQVQAPSPEALDQGAWERIIVPMLTYGGRTMGRFLDLLGDTGQRHLRALLQAEEALLPDVLFVDLNYLPTEGRCANVALHQPLHQYEIVVNTSPSLPPERVIPLDDLVVGVRHQRFYVRSLRLGKELKVFQHTMLNPRYAPNVCRFLLEIAWDGSPVPGGFDWGLFRDAPFLPRLTAGRIVVSLAQWNVQWADIEDCEEEQEEEQASLTAAQHEERWFAALQRWRTQWQVPRYVCLTHLDQRLPLDLERPVMAHELWRELRACQHTGRKVRLQEMLPDPQHLWLRDTTGAPYVAELVVPLHLCSSADRQRDPSLCGEQEGESHQALAARVTLPFPPTIIPHTARLHLPGDEWLFLKLYAACSFHEVLLREPVRQIVTRLRAEGMCDAWFYVRYADPEPHLRLRLHVARGQSPESLLSTALAWAKQLLRDGFLTNVQVASYEQEVERYGGPEAIEVIEAFFSANSDAMLALLMALASKSLSLEPVVAGVFCLDHLFASWGYDLEARLQYARQRTGPYEAVEAFRVYRPQLPELLVPWRMGEHDPLWHQRARLRSLLASQDTVLSSLVSHIQTLLDRQALWQTKDALVGSLAHLQMNRLLGMTHPQEQQVVALWRQSLEAIWKRPRGDHQAK